MSKTIVVCGHGPGISDAVAKKFGAEGFAVAVVARSKDKLDAAVARLTAAGVKAKAFACDLGEVKAVGRLVSDVRAALGPITVIHWNAYAGLAGDLTTAGVADLQRAFDVSVSGLVVAVQGALPDMKAEKTAAVLITGGGFCFYDTNVDKAVVQWNAMGLAVSKAAQHKLAGVLHQRLKKEGIYVGEIVITGMVKGTAFDHGQATLDPAAIARRFWALYQARTDASITFS